MVDNQFVEAVTASLIREYLSRKGLKATLQSMDIEMPRTESSINNRVALMKQLHIEKLMKKNKADSNPLRSMVEVVTKFILEQSDFCNTILAKSNSSSKSSQLNTASERKEDKEERKEMMDVNKFPVKSSLIGANGDFSPKAQSEIASQVKSTNNSRKLNGHGLSTRSREEAFFENFSPLSKVKDEVGAIPVPPEASLSNALFDEFFHGGHCKESKFVCDYYHPKTKNKTDLLQDLVPESLKLKEPKNILSNDNDYLDDNLNAVKETVITGRRSSSVETLKGLSIEDVDDSEFLDFTVPSSRISQTAPMSTVRKPIDLNTAMKLKTLILGSPNSQFSQEWAKQNLEFCSLPKLQYGIVQKKGGPCGVLAAVQAYVLLEMLFGEDKVNTDSSFEPSPEKCRTALAAALSKIFWQAGEHKSAVVTLSSSATHFIGGNKCKPDRLTETLMLYQFTSYKELNSFIKKNIILFEAEGSSGLILALYSAILSRSVQKIRSEMDEPNSKLMGSYGYCSQEVVNLFVTGNAVSNVFDNKMELDSGTENVTVLRGIQHPSDIGFLSLFEHYNNTKVGSYYKNPKYPIWIVCSESHFTVLFSMSDSLVKDNKAEKFDLYYYDGLAKQQQPIRLTIDISNPNFKIPSDDDMVPPLDLCIRTKWHNARIDWNSTEPLL
ncbi:probable ubiquitin carboxyl-terminal hydrolase MINDY-4 isoform X1 [Octopus sinensis]|uniref:Ubiquitin carboxyl-terminal hydrolase MINDY n=1 Tax=Octopus sinensis TaxID=2607531 RepID=A0A6P7SRN2_9MOLL|nr:probable ubiquitin carboxyl-terminal hydrolase MINDY-4 isoform X1 [Octopus sinensis]